MNFLKRLIQKEIKTMYAAIHSYKGTEKSIIL